MSERASEDEYYIAGLTKRELSRTYVEQHYGGRLYNPGEEARRLLEENIHLRHRIAVLEKELALARQEDQPK